MFGQAEVQRRIGIGGGDDVPAGASSAQVVEGGEAARDMEGRVECRGGGGDEPDALGDGGQRGQQREGLEGGRGVAAPQRLDRHVQNGQMIGHEEGVELGGLQALGEMPIWPKLKFASG